jgi:hypothetical protein
MLIQALAVATVPMVASVAYAQNGQNEQEPSIEQSQSKSFEQQLHLFGRAPYFAGEAHQETTETGHMDDLAKWLEGLSIRQAREVIRALVALNCGEPLGPSNKYTIYNFLADFEGMSFGVIFETAPVLALARCGGTLKTFDSERERRIVLETSVKGAFQGCDRGRVYELTNGQTFECTSYKFSYHYNPDVTIFSSSNGVLMLIDDEEFEGRLQ